MVIFFKRVIVTIYVILMLLVGMFLLLVSLDLLPPERLKEVLSIAIQVFALKVSFGIIGGIFVLMGVIALYRLEISVRRNRIIAFQNPDGEVSVSLSAIEDYVCKQAKNISGIKAIRSRVSMGKKGIDIETIVSVAASTNIPQLTERIQMDVINKVQSMLGVEEKINMKMHIKNIAKGTGEVQETPEEDLTIQEEDIPYRNIGL